MVDKLILNWYDFTRSKTDERESTSEEAGIASCGRWKRGAGIWIECTREGKLNSHGLSRGGRDDPPLSGIGA